MIAQDSDTHPSLLSKLQSDSRHDEVWPLFAEKYGTLLFEWCLRWGASPTDAEDIVQQTLLNVFRHVELFRHGNKGSFRAWLRRIARNVWLKIVEKSMRVSLPGDCVLTALADNKQLRSGAAREDLLNRFDALACDEIRHLAHERVRSRVSPKTWDAFILSDHDRLPGKEIADRLGTSLKAVHLSALRVRRMIRQEIASIDPSLLPALDPHESSEGTI